MKNYKLDIKQMTDDFNIAYDFLLNYELITQKYMIDAVIKKAVELGYERGFVSMTMRYFLLYNSDDMSNTGCYQYFSEHENVQIGLEFFNLKPQKFVNVRMPETDYNNAIEFNKHNKVDAQIDKWELIDD